VGVTTLALLFKKDLNISQRYKKLLRHNLHLAMGTPPAFSTRERDEVYVPEQQTFVDAFKVLSLPYMSSKTKEMLFKFSTGQYGPTTKASSLGFVPLSSATGVRK
jgi:hypothetical protein